MTRAAREKLTMLAMVVFAGCSRDATLTPAPEGPAPALTPAARPTEPPAERPPCLEKFELFDGNGDGRLSPDEFEDHSSPHTDPAVIFRLRDANGDGLLSEAEFCSAQAKTPGPAPGTRVQSGAMR